MSRAERNQLANEYAGPELKRTELVLIRDWIANGGTTPRPLRPAKKFTQHPGGKPADTVAVQGRTRPEAGDMVNSHGDAQYSKGNPIKPAGAGPTTRMTRKPKP